MYSSWEKRNRLRNLHFIVKRAILLSPFRWWQQPRCPSPCWTGAVLHLALTGEAEQSSANAAPALGAENQRQRAGGSRIRSLGQRLAGPQQAGASGVLSPGVPFTSAPLAYPREVPLTRRARPIPCEAREGRRGTRQDHVRGRGQQPLTRRRGRPGFGLGSAVRMGDPELRV